MAGSENTTGFVQQMMQVFTLRDKDGNAVFSAAEIRHFIPYLLFRLPFALENLPDEIIRIVADALTNAGVDESTPAEQSGKLVADYYKKNPPSAQLLQVFDDKLREWNLTQADLSKVGAQAAKLIGAARSSGVLDSGQRPTGTIAAGPMARFNITNKP